MRFDDAFANGKYITGAADFPPAWKDKAARLRKDRTGRARLGVASGPGERHWFDLFLPDGESRGLVVFVHGGYWLAFGPRDFSHLASGALACGWAFALPAYTLAPAATLPEMTREIERAVVAAAAEVAGPIVVCGHSAGGHLAARLACADAGLDPAVAARVGRIVPISPLSDLRPLQETSMNSQLRIDAECARTQSPALLPRRQGVGVHVWVGGAERPRFLDQARRLGNAWSCPVTVEPGRHHFDVIEGLERAESPLIATLLE